MLQDCYGLRAGGFQHVALDLAPRALRRAGSSYIFARASRVPMASVAEMDWRPGTTHDRQDVTVKLFRGDGVQRMVFWCASGSSNGCLPTGHFPQWK
eukprot:6338469-Pyramimonas_sp.AAC.1